MVEITRHFTSSVYIVYNNKVLLHIHKKLNILLPPGGHLDRDELPFEAAIREAKEECGLDIEIKNFKNLETFNEVKDKNEQSEMSHEFDDESFEINTGEFCNVHFINQYHQHIDFVYFATSLNEIIKPGKLESKHWSWFSKEEIETHTQIKPAVKKYALFALENIEN